MIVEAVGRLFLAPGSGFAAVERTLVAAAEGAEGQPFDVLAQRFLIAAGSELGRRRGSARDGAG
ncbi:hypothetical protein [Streptomyces sp. NPDC000994]